MKTDRIVIVQCRLSSTRLPGKALMTLGNKTVLDWVLASMHKIPADYYYVATDEASYNEILPVCSRNQFDCFKGSLTDVLQRFVDLLNTLPAKTVIRATADNPFLFYEAAEESVIDFEEKNKKSGHCDYLTYSGLPHGSGVEIFSADSLKKAIGETVDPYDHEHVGPALYNHRDKYSCEFVPAPLKYNFPQLRSTIDTYSDYLRAISVVNYLGIKEDAYTYQEILEALNASQVKNPIIYAPSVEKGHGTGHLHRCLSAALSSNAFVYMPNDRSLAECDSIIEAYKEKGLSAQQIIKKLPDESYLPVIVTDAFSLPLHKYEEFRVNKALISIDEASPYSDFSDYLLDIIPSYKLERRANFFAPSLIEKAKNVKTEPQSKASPVKSVLICLGGEDPAGLTIPAAKIAAKCLPSAEITAICQAPEDFTFGNVIFSPPVKDLKEKLYQYDLVITHYGLTAFEALSAACKVILLPTSLLHVKLAEKYSFAHLPWGPLSEASFRKALNSDDILPSWEKLTRSATEPAAKLASESASDSEKENLASVISKIAQGQRMLCPICGKTPSQPDPIISRNKKRTYRRCKSCGMVYMSFSCEEEKKYQKAYFFEDYKKQYGRTYEEDFDSIKAQGKRRIDNIRSICSGFEDKNILDIGCAYGPFLAAASDAGLKPFGTDISQDAISYVQNKLCIPAVTSAFPEIDTEKEFGLSQFDIVTMWYVIEHFKNLDEVLSKVSSIIKNDGIFAFSTPSGEGVSASSNLHAFYENSPTDHFTVWELTKCENILKKYGLLVEKIVSTGHHPERFPSIKKNKTQKGSLRWNLIEKYSKLMRLGDTVEIYCRKIQK